MQGQSAHSSAARAAAGAREPARTPLVRMNCGAEVTVYCKQRGRRCLSVDDAAPQPASPVRRSCRRLLSLQGTACDTVSTQFTIRYPCTNSVHGHVTAGQRARAPHAPDGALRARHRLWSRRGRPSLAAARAAVVCPAVRAARMACMGLAYRGDGDVCCRVYTRDHRRIASVRRSIYRCSGAHPGSGPRPPRAHKCSLARAGCRHGIRTEYMGWQDGGWEGYRGLGGMQSSCSPAVPHSTPAAALQRSSRLPKASMHVALFSLQLELVTHTCKLVASRHLQRPSTLRPVP